MSEVPALAERGRKRRWRFRDHTQGSLVTSILILALPLLATSVAGGVIFQLVDLTFLSRLGEEPMAAVIVVNQSLRQIYFMMLMGGGFAAQALIAGAVGGGDTERAEHIAGQLVTLGAIFAALIAVLGGAVPEFLFSLPGPDASFIPYGVPYLRLTFLLSFGVVATIFFSSVLGGAGDTTTPLFVMLLQISVSIFAEWVLIFGNLGAPALGVRGAALGMACGHVSGMLVGLWVLFRGKSRVHLRRRHLAVDWVVMRRILALSWPPALQMGSSVVVIIAFLRLSGSFGESVQAAYAIGLRLGMIVPAVCFPLATACATLVGQALGSGNTRRAWRAIGVGLVVHGSVMMSFALITVVFRADIVGFFTDDPEVVRVGSEYLLYAAGSFTLWAFYFVFLRALQGAGDFIVPMLISVGTAFLVTIPLAYGLALGTDLGPTGIWIAHLVSSVVTTLATAAWLATGRWTRRAVVARLGRV